MFLVFSSQVAAALLLWLPVHHIDEEPGLVLSALGLEAQAAKSRSQPVTQISHGFRSEGSSYTGVLRGRQNHWLK